MSGELRIVDACTEEHFRAMSLIHAKGWRDTYADAVPADWMAENVTDERWVPTFRQYAAEGINHGMLLYRGETPVSCVTYGPARIGDQSHGGGEIVHFDAAEYAGWGEIISFYTEPTERGKGYGGMLFEKAVGRLREAGFPCVYVFVLRENERSRRFYERHGFTWDGTHQDIPFPPDTVCVDLRYCKKL